MLAVDVGGGGGGAVWRFYISPEPAAHAEAAYILGRL